MEKQNAEMEVWDSIPKRKCPICRFCDAFPPAKIYEFIGRLVIFVAVITGGGAAIMYGGKLLDVLFGISN